MIKENKSTYSAKIIVLLIIMAAVFFYSFLVGRFDLTLKLVIDVILNHMGIGENYWESNVDLVVMNVRLPRISLAVLVGGALSVSGASYQTLFKNPMAAPDILGVSAGAGFGASLAMLNNGSWWEIQLSAFIFGLAAVLAAYVISNIFAERSITVLILAGVVVSSLFQALLSIVKTLADTESQLPSITFWLMGSMSRGSLGDTAMMLSVALICLTILGIFRNHINVMSAGEDEARTLGVNVTLMKIIIVSCSTLLTVTAVSICGIIGWVGMVIPHIARMLVGADYSRIIPASFLIGGIFLLIIDDIIRGIEGMELPIGVLTALIGTPIFVLFLMRLKSGWS